MAPDEQPAVFAVGKARAAVDVAIQLVGRFGNLALGVVATIVLVKALGIEGNGQWATITAVATLVGIVGEFGLEPTAVRMAAKEREEEAQWLTAMLLLRCALAVPAAILAGLVCLLVSTDDSMALAGALVSATVLVSAPQSLDAVFQVRVRNDIPVLVLTFNSVVWCGAIVVISSLDGSLVTFAAAFLAVTFLTTVLQVVLALRQMPLATGDLLPRARRLLTVGLAVGIGSALTMAYAKIDQVMVLEIAGERDAGLYGSAYILLDRLQFIPSAVMTTAFPLLAASWPADPERVRRLTQRILELLFLASAPVLAFTIVAPEQVITTLFGEEFREAGAALPILMGAFVLIAFGYLLGFLTIVVGAQNAFVKIALAGLVLNVALNLVVIPPYGFVGAAWSTLATEILVCTLAARVTLGRVGMRPALRTPLRVAAAAAVMGAAVEGAELGGAGFLLLVAVGAVVYPVALLASGAVPVADLREARGAIRRKLGA